MYTMKYYSTTRKNEILTFVTAWMDPEDSMLNDISNTERQAPYNHLHVESKTQTK